MNCSENRLPCGTRQMRVIQPTDNSGLQGKFLHRKIAGMTGCFIRFQGCEQAVQAGSETNFQHVEPALLCNLKVSVADKNVFRFGNGSVQGVILFADFLHKQSIRTVTGRYDNWFKHLPAKIGGCN